MSPTPPAKKPAEKLKTASLEKALGYKFKSRPLLKRALTHASVRSQREKSDDNERLEFLGDRVLALAIAELLVEMDADGSHDPASLPAMIDLARAGNDLVIGSRWVDGGEVVNWPWVRQAISRAGNWYARTALRSGIRDITAGFRVYRASALKQLELDTASSQGYCFQVELAWQLERTGHRIAEHPITFVERATGRSKMHSGIVLEALLRVTGWGIAATFAPAAQRSGETAR